MEDTTLSSITISWEKPQNVDKVKGYRITCTPDENKKKQKSEKSSNKEGKDHKDTGSITAPREVKLYGADKTRAKVNELQEGQAYVLEVFALLGEDEGDGTTLKAVASKCLEFRNNFMDKDKKVYVLYIY